MLLIYHLLSRQIYNFSLLIFIHVKLFEHTLFLFKHKLKFKILNCWIFLLHQGNQSRVRTNHGWNTVSAYSNSIQLCQKNQSELEKHQLLLMLFPTVGRREILPWLIRLQHTSSYWPVAVRDWRHRYFRPIGEQKQERNPSWLSPFS